MLNLPASTAFNRRIPKQKFYEELPLTPALRRVFVGQINAIWWRSKIAPATANLAPGRTVTELEVFELQLAQPSLDEGVLRAIDKRIPYPILYLLTCDGRCQAWIGYQPAGQGGARVYYHTAWQPQEDLKLELRGLDTDVAYENFVRQIAGGALDAPAAEPLPRSIARDQRRRALEKQIAVLQNKIRREKQLNRQVELNQKLKELRKEYELYAKSNEPI